MNYYPLLKATKSNISKGLKGGKDVVPTKDLVRAMSVGVALSKKDQKIKLTINSKKTSEEDQLLITSSMPPVTEVEVIKEVANPS